MIYKKNLNISNVGKQGIHTILFKEACVVCL